MLIRRWFRWSSLLSSLEGGDARSVQKIGELLRFPLPPEKRHSPTSSPTLPRLHGVGCWWSRRITLVYAVAVRLTLSITLDHFGKCPTKVDDLDIPLHRVSFHDVFFPVIRKDGRCDASFDLSFSVLSITSFFLFSFQWPCGSKMKIVLLS